MWFHLYLWFFINQDYSNISFYFQFLPAGGSSGPPGPPGPPGECSCNISEVMKSFSKPQIVQGPPGIDGKTGPPGMPVSVVFVTSDKNEGTLFIKIELRVLDNIYLAVDKLLFLFQGEV